MTANTFSPASLREFIICLDSYDGEPHGALYHRRTRAVVPFRGVPAFVLAVEHILDTEDCPGIYEGVDPGPLEFPAGAAATFRLEILFRQNSSWQGRVTWLENKTEATFRSLLELILILDEALAD